MNYVMHRIFCAAPGDLAAEQQAFYDAVGEFNSALAMPQGILFVALAVPGTTVDKRPYQAVIGDNIRSCRYYVQLLEETWGPPERNFEREHALAEQCAADPALPMQEVVVFFKKPLVPHHVEPSIAAFKRERQESGRSPADLESPAQLRQHLLDLLAGWLASVTTSAAGA